jgi:hypothetical protein
LSSNEARQLKTEIMKAIENVVEYTNVKIQNWYKEVKITYGVIGSGVCKYNELTNTMTVEYVEDGKCKIWEMPFYPEYTKEQSIDWVFNCWGELA